ncbi:hypothetical protein HD553DRAFT_311206 [Filobasidium floriforme]|uniref:uncharacterized protein n=1 Tax=Filobasidium floriforme TaxID=5210 RepID=UPI001E8D7D78|nr:uncharacterized protein HD553DRAFT_311206 [Filobasidium floriforme]KAH8084562.1 hypothetical protein HD553DRAFT_311206 [Filobasidium floriforme]
MYTTPRRSPKASPTSSPASAYFNSPNDPSASPSAQLGRGRAGNAGSGVLLTDWPNDAKVDGLPPPAFGVKTRSMKLAEKRIVSGSNLSPKEKKDSVRHPESKDGRYDDINEEDDEENDEEEEVVDGLIERMQRNMRIVSSTSTIMARPRMSEVEADEVDGALGQVPEEIGGTQEERSPDQEISKEEPSDREAAPGRKALKSLRQPAIQPRMNKSTLARLNPTTPATRPESPRGDMTTPSRATSRRPASVAVFRPSDIPAKGSASWNVGMETPRRKVQTSDGVEGGNKRLSTVITPASLRPPAIVSSLLFSLVRHLAVVDDPLPLIIDATSYPRL